MKNINSFEKVSLDRYKEDFKKVFVGLRDIDDYMVYEIYNNIKLPKRATKGSAGYDFFIPFNLSLTRKSNIVIPTGIRCKMNDNEFLALYPRSGHGFKYHLSFANTVGIIDSDYYYSDNEGHIMVELVYNSFAEMSVYTVGTKNISHGGCSYDKFKTPEVLEFKEGTAICQGIFTPFNTTKDDNVTEIRNGGMGSTDK